MPLVRRLALLLALEGGVLILLALGYGVASLTEDGDGAASALVTASGLLTGLLLLVLARATAARRTWARGPAVTLNIFPFPVALYLFEAGLWWVGVPLLLLAGAVLFHYGTPEVRSLFREGG